MITDPHPSILADCSRAKSIMLVEDDLRITLGMIAALESFGHTVCASVQTGEEAVIGAAELSPDIILMDINLKGDMDGVEAAELIASTSCVPVIYLSAQTDEATKIRAMSTRHYGYLRKPFDADELQSTIESTLQRVGVVDGAFAFPWSRQ